MYSESFFAFQFLEMKRRASFTLAGRSLKVRSTAARQFKKPRALIVVPRPSVNFRQGGYIDIEKKFVDYSVTGDAFTSIWAGGEMDEGTALSLSAVAQGDGESQRDGRVYHIHSVHVRGQIKRAALEGQTAPISDAVARIALVWDTQTNGAQLNAEDVMLTIGAASDVYSWRNLQFSKRFIVLKDKTFRVASNNQTNEGASNLFANGDILIPFKINKTFKKPIKVRCKATTATVAAITDNSLHLIGTATTTGCNITYESRVRFTG